MQQEAQQMFGISGIGILGMGLVIVIVLLVIGFREKEDVFRKERFIRAAGVVLGVLIIVTGFTWYSTVVAVATTPMTFEDVLIITGFSSIGGLISGISCYFPINK